MNLRHIALIVILLGGLAACKSSQKANSNTPPVQEEITDDTFRKVIKDRELFTATTESILVDTAYLTRDTLHLFTPRLLACDAEEFKLLWNGAMAKSFPPQASLKLLLVRDPACKETHRFHLKFNVSNVKMGNDSSARGSTIIRVPGLKTPVKYDY